MQALGKGKLHEVLVSLCDLDKIQEVTGVWYVDYAADHLLYVKTCVKGSNVQLHRYLTECPSDKVVDHKDRNTLNNTRDNLRVTTKSKNGLNARTRSGSKSGVPGVTFSNRDNKWRVRVPVEGVQRQIGQFLSLEEAIEARTKFIESLE